MNTRYCSGLLCIDSSGLAKPPSWLDPDGPNRKRRTPPAQLLGRPPTDDIGETSQQGLDFTNGDIRRRSPNTSPALEVGIPHLGAQSLVSLEHPPFPHTQVARWGKPESGIMLNDMRTAMTAFGKTLGRSRRGAPPHQPGPNVEGLCANGGPIATEGAGTPCSSRPNLLRGL